MDDELVRKARLDARALRLLRPPGAAFPLYRNWKLALRVVADVAAICEAGQACAVRCLLQIKSVFDHDETRYHLSKL